MRAKLISIALALAVGAAGAKEVRAQLFGERTLGRSALSRTRPSLGGRTSSGTRSSIARSSSARSSSSAASLSGAIGTPDPAARYVRGNRQATDFVGTDSRDMQGFVGMQQAEGSAEIESAVSGLRIETGPDANRTQATPSRPRVQMYDPRLKVNFDFPRQPTGTVNLELARRLEASLRLSGTGRIEVLQEGATAILRGEVASERDRRLAGLLILLEPGISNVRNELVVKAPQPAGQASSPAENHPRLEDQP